MPDVPLTQDIFIAVDGGATKTIARAENAAGELIGEGRGGPANIRLSVEKSWASILEAVDETLQGAGIGAGSAVHRMHCGAGLAGCEVKGARRRFLATDHPFATLEVRSDGYTSCLGAHEGEDGAVIAAGTGIVGYQIEDGRECRVGGWGFPHGDEGSGAWLGLETIRRTLQWLDGRGTPSPLLNAVLARFDNDVDALSAWANSATATRFAEIAPLVVTCGAEDDPVAHDLLLTAAREIDRIGDALAGKTGNGALACCLLGGLAPHLEPFLCNRLRARLVPARGDAVRGAMIMIRRAMKDRPIP